MKCDINEINKLIVKELQNLNYALFTEDFLNKLIDEIFGKINNNTLKEKIIKLYNILIIEKTIKIEYFIEERLFTLFIDVK